MVRNRERTLPPPVEDAVNPGGSGIAAFFFAAGGELRSRTHCGGGGAVASIFQVVMAKVLRCDKMF
jgi:hypothetical protein